MIEAVGIIDFDGRLDEVIKKIVPFIESGFYVKEVKSYIDWPYFWRRVYECKLEMHVVYDGENHAMLPSTEQILKQLI